MILNPKDLPIDFKNTFYLSVNYGNIQHAKDLIAHLQEYIAWAKEQRKK